jgi:glycosyltransferase involved in cell wall biosynthesis
MKIAHIITSLDKHGAQMMLLKTLSAMDRSRFDSVVISLTDGGALKDRFAAIGVTAHSAGMKKGVPTPGAIYRLARLMKQIKPDLIQGWMYHGNLAGQMASAFSTERAPVVWNIRGSSYDLKKEKAATAAIIWLGARLSGLPKAIINNSLASAIKHEQKLGYRAGNRVIIPNGFDRNQFVPSPEARAELRNELGLPGDALLIGLIARYHPVKDHANFLQAAGLLLSARPQARFVLAGEGVDESKRELRELIAALPVAGRVHLLGERNDMNRVTAALDIATSSSSAEAFPNVIGEAMACGVPCAVTEVGDSAFLVGETGRRVPPRNAQALASAWGELIEMGEQARRELGEEARRRVIEQFSIEAVARSYESLYQQVFSNLKNRGALANVRYRWFL